MDFLYWIHKKGKKWGKVCVILQILNVMGELSHHLRALSQGKWRRDKAVEKHQFGDVINWRPGPIWEKLSPL